MVQRRFFHCSVVSSSISTFYGAFCPFRRRGDVRHRPTTTPLTESVEEFKVTENRLRSCYFDPMVQKGIGARRQIVDSTDLPTSQDRETLREYAPFISRKFRVDRKSVRPRSLPVWVAARSAFFEIFLRSRCRRGVVAASSSSPRPTDLEARTSRLWVLAFPRYTTWKKVFRNFWTVFSQELP